MNIARFGVIVGVSLLVACTGRNSADIAYAGDKYRRWQAPGEFARTFGGPNVRWIDDDNVLYLAKGESHLDHKICVWTLSTGHVREIGPAAGDICYFDGYLRYVEREHWPNRVVREGTLAETKATVVPVTRERELLNEGYRRHPFTCGHYRVADLAPEENCKVPLLPGHGWLETQGGRCRSEYQSRLHAANQSSLDENARREEKLRIEYALLANPIRYFSSDREIVLPIEANEVDWIGSMSFSPWKGAYLIPQRKAKGDYGALLGRWPRENYDVYVLLISGQVETVSVPWNRKFYARPGLVALSKAGLILAPNGYDAEERKVVHGLLLFARDSLLSLDVEDTQQISVSPNGCRLAYDAKDLGATKRGQFVVRLRVIDVCAETNP